jgi:hypothetical protein
VLERYKRHRATERRTINSGPHLKMGQALPVASDEKGTLSIARRRKR